MSHQDTQSITGMVLGSVLLADGRITCGMGLPIDRGAQYHYRTESLLKGYGKVWRVGLNEPKGLGVPVAEPTVALSVASPRPSASGLSTAIADAPAHETPEQR